MKLSGIFLHIHQVIHENFEVDAKKIQKQKTRYRESSISTVCTCTDFSLVWFFESKISTVRNRTLKKFLKSTSLAIFHWKRIKKYWGSRILKPFLELNHKLGPKSFLKSTFLANFHKISSND